MKKVTFFIGMLVLTLVYLSLSPDKVHAYTLKDIDKYIDNPEFHDNQDGRASYNIGINAMTGTADANINVESIYLDSKHKTFQILARQYNPKKGIDLTSKDMKWSVIDERICTVDSNGKVKAGKMTGVTIIIMEEKSSYVVIPVVNLTGKYDSWYEDMFKDVKVYPFTFTKSDFISKTEAKNAYKYMGNAYKTITDAYLTYGDDLKANPEVRIDVIKEAVEIVYSLKLLRDNKDEFWLYAEDVGRNMTSCILDLFVSKDDKCGWTVSSGVNVFLMDGIIYVVKFDSVEEVGKESDCIWKKGTLYGVFKFEILRLDREQMVYKKTNVIVKTEISLEKGGSFSADRDYMTEILKN